MIDSEIQSTFFLVLKFAGIIFALMHFFIGILMYRQIIRMKQVIRTKSRGCVVFVSLFHILLLLIVLILVILIPTS